MQYKMFWLLQEWWWAALAPCWWTWWDHRTSPQHSPASWLSVASHPSLGLRWQEWWWVSVLSVLDHEQYSLNNLTGGHLGQPPAPPGDGSGCHGGQCCPSRPDRCCGHEAQEATRIQQDWMRNKMVEQLPFLSIYCILYMGGWWLNCFKVSESNNSDVRGFLWSSWPLHNF